MVTDIQLEVSTSLDRPGSSLKDQVLLQEQLVRCPAELAPIESLHLKPHKNVIYAPLSQKKKLSLLIRVLDSFLSLISLFR